MAHPYWKMAGAGLLWAAGASVANFALSVQYRDRLLQEYVSEHGLGGSTDYGIFLLFEAFLLDPFVYIIGLAIIFPVVSAVRGRIYKYGFATLFSAAFVLLTFRTTTSFWLLTLLPSALAFVGAVLTAWNGASFVAKAAHAD